VTARPPQGAPVIVDLHLHTTASDGRLTPLELVDQVTAAGVQVMAVTDHDTTAATGEARVAAAARGVALVSGIEITAVENGRDVHVLGYFIGADDPALAVFLQTARRARIVRVEAMAGRLAALGVPIDVSGIVAEARQNTGRSIGRPQVARALVAAGHVADMREAFDRWLGNSCPGFIPREGASPEQVIAIIHRAGGIASLAHPGKTAIDSRIPALAAAGLDALEAFHPDHDEAMTRHYRQRAEQLGMLVTAGSDFHGDPSHGRSPGSITLPPGDWERLRDGRL
jgi:predicted metal-dependent phosphoesterase TrpH